jgi:hypothetical protein
MLGHPGFLLIFIHESRLSRHEYSSIFPRLFQSFPGLVELTVNHCVSLWSFDRVCFFVLCNRLGHWFNKAPGPDPRGRGPNWRLPIYPPPLAQTLTMPIYPYPW